MTTSFLVFLLLSQSEIQSASTWKRLTPLPFDRVDPADTVSRVVEMYYLQLSEGSCSVNVMENDEGLMISATRSIVGGEQLTELATITKQGNVENRFRVFATSLDNFNITLPASRVPLLFSLMCVDAAKQLPPEVKEKFKGQFGIRP